MTQYFEDMWLALEQELSSFDSFSPNEHVSHPSTSSDPNATDSPQGNLEPATYEQLLEMKKLPNPSHDRLRSNDRKERIEAVKELYNKVPTIINATSIVRLHKTASILYKKGFVKQANDLVEKIDQSVSQHFSYVAEDGDNYKTLSYDKKDGDKDIVVEVIDKQDKKSIKEEFANLSDAIRFFMKE